MKKVFFYLFIVCVAVSCKKENRIENNLWKQGGEWNITSWQESQTSTFYMSDNYSTTTQNAGTMQFNKDGSGSFTFIDGTDAYSDKFTYKNTENSLTIFDTDGEGTIFVLNWKKNAFTISSNSNNTYSSFDQNGNPIIVTSTFSNQINCEKKK